MAERGNRKKELNKVSETNFVTDVLITSILLYHSSLLSDIIVSLLPSIPSSTLLSRMIFLKYKSESLSIFFLKEFKATVY